MVLSLEGRRGPRIGGGANGNQRCEVHHPHGRRRRYVATVYPVGYPQTALICGSSACDAPALIWLELEEKARYDRGERIFEAFAGSMMKVQAV